MLEKGTEYDVYGSYTTDYVDIEANCDYADGLYRLFNTDQNSALAWMHASISKDYNLIIDVCL